MFILSDCQWSGRLGKMTVSVLSLTYLLPSLVLPSIITSADALKGENIFLSLENHQSQNKSI